MKKFIIIIIVVLGSVLAFAFIPRPFTYDALKTGKYVTAHAAPRSQGLCAMYVRKALEAGGCNTWGHPHTAAGYDDFLESMEFTCISRKHYSPQVGDIVVFNAVKGHPYGHIAIWNGRQWVSDFRQKGMFVASAYSSARDYKYYRMTKKNPKRHFKMKHHITALIADPFVTSVIDLLNI